MSEMFERISASGVRSVAVPGSMIRSVRSNIQDYASTNELFEGEENANERIGRFILRVVDDFNGTPPVFKSGIEPMALAVPNAGPLRSLIITGSSVLLLNSVMLKLARNDVQYTTGNVSIQRNAVWRNLQPLVAEMKSEYEQKKTSLKVAANVSGGWGGFGGNGGLNIQLYTPDGGWRAMLTELYDMLDADSVYISI